MTVRWTLEDESTLDEYTFEMNPDTAKIPGITKTINYENTSAGPGRAIIFEGRDEVPKGSFGGKILSEQQYNDMKSWSNRRHQVLLTDDLGREFSIYITDIDFNRLRRAGNPWYHDFTVNFTILDWPA